MGPAVCPATLQQAAGAVIPRWFCLPGDAQEDEIISTKLRTGSSLGKLRIGLLSRIKVSLI